MTAVARARKIGRGILPRWPCFMPLVVVARFAYVKCVIVIMDVL
jgi:hypothetical protein